MLKLWCFWMYCAIKFLARSMSTYFQWNCPWNCVGETRCAQWVLNLVVFCFVRWTHCSVRIIQCSWQHPNQQPIEFWNGIELLWVYKIHRSDESSLQGLYCRSAKDWRKTLICIILQHFHISVICLFVSQHQRKTDDKATEIAVTNYFWVKRESEQPVAKTVVFQSHERAFSSQKHFEGTNDNQIANSLSFLFVSRYLCRKNWNHAEKVRYLPGWQTQIEINWAYLCRFKLAKLYALVCKRSALGYEDCFKWLTPWCPISSYQKEYCCLYLLDVLRAKVVHFPGRFLILYFPSIAARLCDVLCFRLPYLTTHCHLFSLMSVDLILYFQNASCF